MPKVNRVYVRVPASTSNLGSGFDTLGLALNCYARFCFESASELELRCRPGLLDPKKLHPLVAATSRQFFQAAGLCSRSFAMTLDNEIPVERGLGFSAAIRLGVLFGLDFLFKGGLKAERLLELAIRMEGHPDNATPSARGGFTVSGFNGQSWEHSRFNVSSKIHFVTLVPSTGLSTKKARRVLPEHYSRADAAHALNRAAMITALLAQGRVERLRGFLDDRFHEPCRASLVGALKPSVRAGVKAGAIGGFLSGAGSAVICLTQSNPERVGRAMLRQCPGASVLLLRADAQGVRVRPIYD